MLARNKGGRRVGRKIIKSLDVIKWSKCGNGRLENQWGFSLPGQEVSRHGGGTCSIYW